MDGMGGMAGMTAFGAGKAGGAFDPISFVTRPQVILRFLCWIFSVIVFGCISAKGWYEDRWCIYNKNGNACRFGSIVGFVGLGCAIALLALEAFFQNIPSIKIRRRAVLLDLGFSGLWAVLYFLIFAYIGISWSKSDYPPFGFGINNARAAIAFAFFSVFSWAGCAYFAYQRYLTGADMTQFASNFEQEVVSAQAGEYGGGYTGDDMTGGDQTGAYANNPFAAGDSAYVGQTY